MTAQDLKEHRENLRSLLESKKRKLLRTTDPQRTQQLKVQIDALENRVTELESN